MNRCQAVVPEQPLPGHCLREPPAGIDQPGVVLRERERKDWWSEMPKTLAWHWPSWAVFSGLFRLWIREPHQIMQPVLIAHLPQNAEKGWYFRLGRQTQWEVQCMMHGLTKLSGAPCLPAFSAKMLRFLTWFFSQTGSKIWYKHGERERESSRMKRDSQQY